MSMTSHPLGVDSSEHELIIGSSFGKPKNTAYHSMRYDFKPASVDTSQPAVVDVGENNDVTVTVPHVPNANKSQMYTVYKGNKRPVQKDCVLIIDHETGDIRLEKLSYNIALKKTRAERKTPLVAPPIPSKITGDLKSLKKKKPAKKEKEKEAKEKVEPVVKDMKSSASISQSLNNSPHEPAVASPQSAQTPEPTYDFGSSSSSSESDSDTPSTSATQKNDGGVKSKTTSDKGQPSDYMSTLSEDLLLSESGSDSD